MLLKIELNKMDMRFHGYSIFCATSPLRLSCDLLYYCRKTCILYLCCVQIPSQEFPVLDLVSASGDYRDLVGMRGEEVGEWRGREEEREDSQRRNDIILIVFWQV